MFQKLTSFAAIRTFYDSGNDLIGVFGNLVLIILPPDSRTSISDIKKIIENKIKLIIPNDVLTTIIKRLRKKNYLSYDNIKNVLIKSILLTEDGQKEQSVIGNSFKDAERQNKALIKSIRTFIRRRQREYAEETIESSLDSFIDENSYDATLALESGLEKIEPAKKRKLHSYIAEYFVESEKSDPGNFRRLKAILYGKIISSALLRKNFERGAKYESLDIYLDTNIIFSLLEYHEDFQNTPVKELIRIIKKLDFRLKIFSFTKDEITYKLRGYLKNYENYSSEIGVDSIYHVLKRKGYSKSDIMSIIENIDSKLENLGIEVDYSLNFHSILAGEEKKLSKMGEHMPLKTAYPLKHDHAIILAIQKLRGTKTPFHLEKSRYVFLTADAALSSYNSREFNHNEIGTFPEIVFRSELTSILWLKNQRGSDNVFVHNFIANHARKNLISKALWEKFIRELRSRKEKGIVTEEEIESMISREETESILREKGARGLEELFDDRKIKKKKEVMAERDKKIAGDSATIEQQAEQLSKISSAIEENCMKKWSLIINFAVCIVGLLLIGFIMFLGKKYGPSLLSNILAYGGIPPIFILCISLIIKREFKFLSFAVNSRKNVENKRIKKCIEKKKKELRIL